MKKLMIAAAVVCAAAFAQAASIDWSAANNTFKMQNKSGTVANSTIVYLINADSKDAIIEAINGGATSFTTADTGILGIAKTSNTKGAVASTTASSTSLTAGTPYDYSILVIDTTSVAGTTYYAISASKNKAAYDKNDEVYSEVTSVAFGSADFNSGTGWTKVESGTVPEPTSAMLLVLGVAGLALRRRRT